MKYCLGRKMERPGEKAVLYLGHNDILARIRCKGRLERACLQLVKPSFHPLR